MKALPLTATLCLVLNISFAGQIEILTTGDYRVGELTTVSGDEWLCVDRPAEGKDYFDLRSCRISLRELDGEGQLLVDDGSRPLFLVRGSSLLEPCAAQGVRGSSALLGRDSGLTPLSRSGSIDLEFGEEGVYHLELSKGQEKTGDGGCRLELSHGGSTQLLRTYDQCGGFTRDDSAQVWVDRGETLVLRFAGDLDHDGRLDLLIGSFDVAGRGIWRLYLSTAASRGDFVGTAAKLSHAGSWPVGWDGP